MSENYAHNSSDPTFLIEALRWYLDNGVDELLLDNVTDRTVLPEISKVNDIEHNNAHNEKPVSQGFTEQSNQKQNALKNVVGFQDNTAQQEIMGAAQAIVEAQKIATNCATLEELSDAIKNFDGLSVRKTSTNMVFSDGNSEAPIMLIGEAPGADDDIQGKPFVGTSGQLLDKILACINLSREAENLSKAVYISNILNWRPPGNRTPTQSEMDISLPFIERHIALAKPKAIILCGGVTAKSLLRRSESISKLRGTFHEYLPPENLQYEKMAVIPTMVTYHPTYLLTTPAQKKAVWADMLMFQEKIAGLLP